MNQLPKKSLDALHTLSEEALGEEWIMRFGERIILRASKATAMRTMAMNHMYHHRAQLGVYLRLLDIPVPGMYGPSKDERL
ncbi:MAG TPA: DinB family protein [Saprospiraceae bacterium]|nr:DinB family protein [Saprospiraceae bacterium]